MDFRLDHIAQQFLRLQNFETFQEHMSKFGIVCWIQPDTFLDDINNIGWRGFYFHNGVEDDIGSYSSPHEAKTKLVLTVVEYCIDNNIDLFGQPKKDKPTLAKIDKKAAWYAEYDHIKWDKFDKNYWQCSMCGCYVNEPCMCYAR